MTQRNRSAAAKKGWKWRRAREAFEEERRQRGIAERQAEMPHFTTWLENANKKVPLAGQVVAVDTAYADWEIDRQRRLVERKKATEARMARRATEETRRARIKEAFACDENDFARRFEPNVAALAKQPGIWERFLRWLS